jgi:photosystem II stability/assembly factor-like uncharacterized protein
MTHGTDTSRVRVRRRGGGGLLLLALVAFALVMGLGAPAAASAAGSWTAQTSGTTQLLYGVTFPTALHGWAVGVGGVILVTDDGGATWAPQASGTTEQLWECDSVSVTHAWVGGVGGLMLATTDGGATWTQQQTGIGASIEDVDFVDAQHGWAVTINGGIIATTDGGATWTSQTSGTTAYIYGVCFVDTQHGWAGTDAGTILATTDGGATWTKQTAPTQQSLYGVRFVDTQHGWAVGGGGAVVATTDGGATWTAQDSGSQDQFWRAAAVSGDTLWAVGTGGDIIATTDAGATWAPQISGVTAGLWDVDFALRGRGWAVGYGGVIVAYSEDVTVTTSAPAGHGGISPAGGAMPTGSSPEYSFTPDPGYAVADVLVDGVSVGAPAEYAFDDITASHTLEVAFAPVADNRPSCVVSGWKAGWSNRPVKVRVTGVPGPYGYAIDFIGSTLNGWVLAPKQGSVLDLTLGEQGVTKVTYFAADVNGNSSPTGRFAVRVDTRAPKVVARAASGAAGGASRVRYRVSDAVPGCGRALVRLVVLDAAGKVLTRASTRQAPVNQWRTVRVSTRSLAPGSYRVVLRAMDLARNFQTSVTRATLTVK